MDQPLVHFYHDMVAQAAHKKVDTSLFSCSQLLENFEVFIADVIVALFYTQAPSYMLHVTKKQKPQVIQWCKTACLDANFKPPPRWYNYDFDCNCDRKTKTRRAWKTVVQIRRQFPCIDAFNFFPLGSSFAILPTFFCEMLRKNIEMSITPETFYFSDKDFIAASDQIVRVFQSLGFAASICYKNSEVYSVSVSRHNIRADKWPIWLDEWEEDGCMLPETLRREKVSALLQPFLPPDVVRFVLLPYVCGVSWSRQQITCEVNK